MKYVIIVAGGTGTRMSGAAIPKQFLEIAGKPVIIHTIEAFISFDNQIKIIVALPAQWLEHWKKLKEKFLPGKEILLSKGGETRFHSVKNSLKYTTADSFVAVHDAVRPVINSQLIQDAFTKSTKAKTAIPVLPVFDSLRKNENNFSLPVNRSNYLLVQTPQCFQQEVLVESYNRDFIDSFTDDASVVEAAGFPLAFFEGSKYNIKITTPEDLKLAECLLSQIK